MPELHRRALTPPAHSTLSGHCDNYLKIEVEKLFWICMKIGQCFSFVVLLPRRTELLLRTMPSTPPNPLTWTAARCYIGNPLDSGNSGVFLSIKAWTQHFIVRGRWKIKKERLGSQHRAELFNGKMKAFLAQRNCIAVIWPLHVSKAVVSNIVFYEVLPTKLLLEIFLFTSANTFGVRHRPKALSQHHKSSAYPTIFNLVAAPSCKHTAVG